MTTEPVYFFLHEDTGYCRTYYRRGKEGPLQLRCFQDDGDKINFYTCSRDGEPEFPIVRPPDEMFDRLILPS
jgi:hypothetical protein